MLLGRSNEILLSDFGIAILIESSRKPQDQDTAGNIAYMVPEQLRGKPRPASDQYALGIAIYERLCGEPPFHGPFAKLYSQLLSVAPPPILDRVTALPTPVRPYVL